MLLLNEEEIRGKLLLPYINDLGFDLSEISLETSFTIKLGKSQQLIKGRSDILCKRNGKNLFIIELKSDSVIISQADIDQGISYARLLTENIAPFTIITNGKTTKIFDSVSREELTGNNISNQSSFWKNGFTLSTDTDLQIRYEALKNFISFSSENLKSFCEHQVRDRMGSIIGSIDNTYAKFVKELHIQRQDLQSAFNEFFDSDASFFGIVGSAGVGKTSAMCSLALQKLESEFVFFYNAAIINKSPLDHIVQDLNGIFSNRTESDIVLKKLDELGSFLNKTVLIFIDAVDENTSSNLALDLSEIALSVRYLKKVKVCISCKSNIWKDILKRNGSPTYLFEELVKFHDPISTIDRCPGFLLEDFSRDEIASIVPLYKSIFGFKGQISESILNALRNGFFLRIFSEVYSQREVPVEINDKELIGKYIKKSLEKTNLGIQVGLRILSKIGKVLIEHKYTEIESFYDEGLDVEGIVEKLNFSLDEAIPEDLFTRNLLNKSNKEDSYNISFYYSKIRDYIICFHSYRLDKIPDNEFYDLLEALHENHIGQSAVSFYIENASEKYKMIIIKFKQDKFLKYVNSYEFYLEEHFKKIKEKFDPHTEGAIGVFLPEDLLHEEGYALFHLDANSTNKVQYTNLKNPFDRSYDDNVLIRKGVRRVHGSNEKLLTSNQDKVVRKSIFKQLIEIVKEGKVSVYNSDILLLEQVATILYFYSQKLEYKFNFNDYYLPRFDLIYPINLQDLRDRIFKFRATEYYRYDYLEPELRLKKINEALKSKPNIPTFDTIGDVPLFEELFKIVEILLSKGYKEVTEHHLPCPDISVNEVKALYREKFDLTQIRSLQFSEGQAKKYIEKFLVYFESCYKQFVEYAFPTLKEKLPFFMEMPHEYFVYLNDLDFHAWGGLGYRSSKSGYIEVNYRELVSLDNIFEEKEVNIFRGFSFDQIIHCDYNHVIKTVDKINTSKVDDYCILRSWIYRFLKEDLEALFKENEE